MLLRPVPLRRHSYQLGKFPLLCLGNLQRPSIAIRVERRHVNGPVGPAPGQLGLQGEDTEEPTKIEYTKSTSQWGPTLFKMLESAATTFASLFVLGLAGYTYHRYYKYLILRKMSKAFEPGDPVLELAALEKGLPNTILQGDDQHWIRHAEQTKIDAIVNGTDQCHYHLLIGEKGIGKSSMLLHAMQKVAGEGISMFEAHADLDKFRIRLGKALDYEFHEDYIGSLFSIKGPREGSLLDIERAFNKLEKVALKRRKAVGRPLVLIINSTHLLRDDDGRDLLELIQQRAEQWAASNLVTVVLNSDDYWVYERLKQYSTRMEILPVLDLPKDQAILALKQFRRRYFNEEELPASEILTEVYSRVGGRLTFLNRMAQSSDMLRTCDHICQVEKTWFLNNCWILGEDCDDDVMNQQKYASAAMVLAKALVDKEKATTSSNSSDDRTDTLPEIPLHKARETMTRADFIKSYDHINIFTIDAQAMVRADSVPMQRAFRQICNEPGFEEHLKATLDRIAAIESLGRTREIVAKDLMTGKYTISGRPDQGDGIVVEVHPTEDPK